jgi:AraC-like DNA-binding protein
MATPGTEQTLWTRIDGLAGGPPIDLMAASFTEHRYAPHAHGEFAIGVTTGGLEQIRYRGAEFCSGPGSIVVLEPEEMHTGGPARPGLGYSYRVVYAPPELFVELAGTGTGAEAGTGAGAVGSVPHFRDPVLPDPVLAAELAAAHRGLTGCGDPLEGEIRLLAALRRLAARHGSPRPPEPRPPGRAAAEAVARAVRDRLGDQPVDPPGLGELAAELGLSRYQLLRAFQSATGIPPYAWLAQHRVCRARDLLGAGLRPAEAAAAVGFADQAHLTRWFRRVLGVTPGVYRNSVQDAVLLCPGESFRVRQADPEVTMLQGGRGR